MRKKVFMGIFVFLFALNVDVLYAGQIDYQSKFVPPGDKVLLILGQDTVAIDDYVKEIGIVPAGFTTYTSVYTAEGLYEPIDRGAGNLYAKYVIDKYPCTVLQIGLYMVSALDGVVTGDYDESIDEIGHFIKESKRPVYLRIGYEFDGDHNHYEPEKYIKAYRYIADRLRKNEVNNIAYVWHSFGHKMKMPVMNWYPGDEYVDWFAISFFSHKNRFIEDFVVLADEHKKPMMIAEATPAGIGVGYGRNAVKRYFEPFFKFVDEYGVKAVCYISCDWDSRPTYSDGSWKDGRVHANERVKEFWLNEIKKEKYLQSSPGLFKILGYESALSQ